MWKVIFEIQNSENLLFKIIDCDNGVGVLRKNEMYKYNKMDDTLDNKDYNYFVENIEKLPLISFDEGLKFLDDQYINRK